MKFERLGNIVDILSGFAFQSSLFNVKREGLPLIRVRDVNSGFAGVYYSGVYDKMFLVKNEDLLIGLDGDFKCVEWNNGEALLNQRVCKIIPKKNLVDRNYIFHFLPSALNEIHRNTNYTTVKHLSVKTINDIIIPLPPLRDQIHISSILSKTEKLITQRKQSIVLLDEFLKSTFLEMFGNISTNKKKFPKGTIRDVVSEVKYGTSSPSEDAGEYPYLRMNNITSEGYMDFSKLKYINIDIRDKEKYIVRKGDLIFNRTNSKELVGKTGVFNLGSEMVIAGYLIRVRTNERANTSYLWGYLNSSHGKQTLLGMCKSIVGMANINAQELQGIKILIPPIELQNQFSKIVEKVEALKVEYQNSLQKLENLYASLSQRAFRGELTLKPTSEKVLMAAEPEPIYGKVIEFTSRKCDSNERAILAGHIINMTNKEDFGRVKFQKLLHLTTYHCKIDIDSNFTKKVAGPHDGDLLKDIESTLKRYRYYDINQSKRGNHKVNYTSLSSVSELEEIFDSNFESERERIDSFLAKFRKSSWEQCEIISTLYAVWNNRLILNHEITNELLKQDFLDWDIQKVKYIGRLDDALQWMKTKGVIPDGWGKLIV